MPLLPEFYVGMSGAIPELAFADLQTARGQLHKYADYIPELLVRPLLFDSR